MVQSQAETVEAYLEELPEERRAVVGSVRDVILENLPDGWVEMMDYGMISYAIPLERYSDTYNKHPLGYIALASQKQYVSLYLMTVYGDPVTEAWFKERWDASGKPLNMGKSCVRFRTLDDLPLNLIRDVVRRTTPEDFIALYEASRRRK